MNQNTKTKLWPILLSIAVILLDQITKAIIIKNIDPLSYPLTSTNTPINIIGEYVRIIHVRNNAIAFSMGSSLSANVRSILFGLMPLAVVVAVYVIYFRNDDFTKLQRWAICGILGGGLGNLIDRFFRKDGVIDFIDCTFFGWFGMERWPTFNVADCTVVICGGIFVVTFILQIIKDAKKSGEKKENE